MTLIARVTGRVVSGAEHDGRRGGVLISGERGDLRREWEAKRGRFAQDVRVTRSPWRRAVWIAAGFASLGLGALGVLLPVLPTTPFVILSAACFARSSARFYDMVLSHRIFGPLVYEWRERRTVPKRAKAVAIALIAVTFTVSIVFFVPVLVGQVAMALFGVGVIVWLLTIPSRDQPRG